MKGGFSVEITEDVRVLRGLQLAQHSGLLPAYLESDSQVAVTAIYSNKPSLNDLGLAVADIRGLLSLFPGTVISFVPRSTNKTTNALIAFALTIDSNCFWMKDFSIMSL
ncbi:hypothetical protein ACOSQ4_014472 [Xanthoceras sorbifolium]